MTISSTIRKAGPFIGNGSTTSFPFAFKIFETSDLLVVLLDEATNTETTLVLNSNYTATMNGDQNGNPGGTVTLIAGALASGYTLTITSDLANLQPTDLTNQGGFYPDVINDALDRSTVQIQQLQEQTDRSLKIAVSSTANVTLPPESANQLLGWDATGQNLANIDPGTLATIVAYATAYADTFTGDGTTVNWVLSHDPAVLYNLDVSINGVTQVPTVDYTLAGTTFTTTTAAPTGAVILVKYSQALPNMSADSQDVRYLPPFTGSTSTTVEAKLAQTVSVKDFGAVGDGVTDDGNAIRSAVAAVTVNGGEVYFPAGIYKVTAALGDASNTSIYVPSNVRVFGASEVGTQIVAGANNTVVFRIIGLNGGIENLQVLGAGYSNVSGIRLAPIDETQTTTRSDVEFNNITNISIRNVSEAIVLKCGPRVGSADSYCYYNNFTNIDIRNCTLGIWLKIPNGGDPGSGCNRNRFINVRVGETGTNTGLQIDAGDTNTFVGCSFEGIESGTSPNATPTAIIVAYNSGSYSCTDNKFYGLTIEACTRSVANSNDLLEFYGWYDATGTYNSPAPTGALPLAVNMSRGKNASFMVGTNRTPTCQGDFYNSGGSVLVQAITRNGGAPEFRLDSSTNYGVYSYYANGIKQWSFGNLATGSGDLTFFDANDNPIAKFTSTGLFKPLQSASAPSYIKGGMYFDTTLNKLRIGGASGWETVTSV